MPTDEEMTVAQDQTIKKRGRGGKENFPNILTGAKAEDVSRIMKNCLAWYAKPRIETDDECRQRLLDFFTACMESGELPTVEKMCIALGYARNTVFEWEQGKKCSAERANMIKKAKEFIAAFESEMVTEGKIQPVVYIFRAKNYFGMKDQQDLVLTPNTPLGDTLTPEEIQSKYQDMIEE